MIITKLFSFFQVHNPKIQHLHLKSTNKLFNTKSYISVPRSKSQIPIAVSLWKILKLIANTWWASFDVHLITYCNKEKPEKHGLDVFYTNTQTKVFSNILTTYLLPDKEEPRYLFYISHELTMPQLCCVSVCDRA